MAAEDALLHARSGVNNPAPWKESISTKIFNQCPTCEGDGFELVEIERGNAQIMEIARECDDCSGTGTVNMERTHASHCDECGRAPLNAALWLIEGQALCIGCAHKAVAKGQEK